MCAVFSQALVAPTENRVWLLSVQVCVFSALGKAKIAVGGASCCLARQCCVVPVSFFFCEGHPLFVCCTVVFSFSPSSVPVVFAGVMSSVCRFFCS